MCCLLNDSFWWKYGSCYNPLRGWLCVDRQEFEHKRQKSKEQQVHIDHELESWRSELQEYRKQVSVPRAARVLHYEYVNFMIKNTSTYSFFVCRVRTRTIKKEHKLMSSKRCVNWKVLLRYSKKRRRRSRRARTC